MMRHFLHVTGCLLIMSGCATGPSTPPTTHYLLAGASPSHSEQVEIMTETMIQLRSADVLVQAQAQLIDDAVELQFYVINLSPAPIRLEANDFSFVDAQGKPARLLKINDVLQPLRQRAAQLEEQAKAKSESVKTADAVMNPGPNYNGGSTDQRLAQSLRGERARFEKDLAAPFSSATLPANKRMTGTLYFDYPTTWPIELRVHAADQTLVASFYRATVHP